VLQNRNRNLKTSTYQSHYHVTPISIQTKHWRGLISACGLVDLVAHACV